ncbi:hypothetical protein ACHAXT_008174 [Thalassiosira profunda]
MGKGYKLTSAAGSGPKTCAFFFSDKGCRNGANCKFSHDKPPAGGGGGSTDSSSVVSSESEGEVVEQKAGAYASLAKNQTEIRQWQEPPQAAMQPPQAPNPFLTGVPVAPPPSAAKQAAPPTEPPKQQQQQSTEKKKKKRSKKRKSDPAPGESIFDLGKSEDKRSPAKKAKKAASPPNNQKQRPAPANNVPPTNPAVASFRTLNLPIASFSIPSSVSKATAPPRPATPQHEPAPVPPPLPLPTATAAHLKWKDAVIATRSHANYPHAYNWERSQQFEFNAGLSTHSDWTAAKPYGAWCAANPSAVAIDCEMCQTRDPVTGRTNDKALCRVSLVNAQDPNDVLLDTLVKPEWPVSDHRTWVNGISAKDLEDVKFTLKHAQQFLGMVCSDQTVIVGHAVHNDLLALRMVHHCTVDTAMLFVHKEEEAGTPSLKNLAHGVLGGREMPDVHDSVNDARVALLCAEHYVAKGGKVAPIEKVFSRSPYKGPKRIDDGDTSQLLVHRLPTATKPEHLSEMFVAYTQIKPKTVPEIVFSGQHGKCHVEFSSKEHAELAYRTLVGEEREDKTGKKQKRVGLKGGGYVCVRRMRKGK